MKFIFIGGAQRAGTSLLHSIVCSTQATPPPVAEDGTVRYLAMAHEDTIRRFDQHAGHFFQDRDEAARFYRRLILQYLEQVAKRWPDASHVVLKQPLLTPHFPTLAKLLPKAGFIIAMRDPRDIVASLLEVADRESVELGTPSARKRPGPFTRHALRFYERPMKAFGSRDGKRAVWIHYEEMVRDPETVARRLGSFTGIDLSGYQSGEPWRGWSDGTVDLEERRKSPYFSPLWGQAVTAERIGAWRGILTEKEAVAVTRAAKPIMQAFGYGDAGTPVPGTTTGRQE